MRLWQIVNGRVICTMDPGRSVSRRVQGEGHAIAPHWRERQFERTSLGRKRLTAQRCFRLPTGLPIVSPGRLLNRSILLRVLGKPSSDSSNVGNANVADIVGARQRATRERGRALRAAGIAGRHELLAAQAIPSLRGLHREMAELHRGIERRHLAAARMHTEYGDRLAAWAERRANPSSPPRFITAVAATVGARHVGLSLVLADRTEAVTVASDDTVAAVQELEFTLGEGPMHDVTAAAVPVVVDREALPRRWPRFAPEAARLGVSAVAAAPLRTDAGCLGALTVFDPPVDPDRATETVCAVADALVHTALLAPDGPADPLDLPLLAEADVRVVVHQASGIIAQRYGCGVGDGLALLRARAFAEDTPLAAVAAEVVHRRSRSS